MPKSGTLFTAATVIDGTESPRYRADVRVVAGRIAEIAAPGTLDRLPGETGVDADSLVLSPGFIDMHAHSDLQLLANPQHPAKLSQGVTTELLGQDGLSYAPVDDEVLAVMRGKIAGWNDDPAGFDYSWRSVGEYLDRLDLGIATNGAYLVPHGTLRALVVGLDDRPASRDELARMKLGLRTSMGQGAVGLSAGLTYTPGMYADNDELNQLCAVVGQLGGFFAPHHRSYGAGALQAYAEMIEVTSRAGCALHLSHATMNFGPNKGRAPELIALLDKAIAAGADITLDTYPYLPGATTLSAILPSWSSAGGIESTLARLRDPASLGRIREHLEVTGSDGCHGVTAEWDTLQISGVRHAQLERYVGATIAQIAAAEGRDPFEVCVDILVVDELGTGILQHVGHEENVRTIMQHPGHTGGSDGLLVGGKPHPRAWGTFPRFLGHYSRDLGLIPLEEMVGHLTGRAARRLRLAGRGLVKTGYAADLVLFDPQTIADTATFDQPRRPAAGIVHVLVNGVPAMIDGALTGELGGRSLRRQPTGEVL